MPYAEDSRLSTKYTCHCTENSSQVVIEYQYVPQTLNAYSINDHELVSGYAEFLRLQSLQSSSYTIPIELMSRIDRELDYLAFSDAAPKQIAESVAKELLLQGYSDFSISRTGGGELLFFVGQEDSFKNILIDEDGDIELIFLPADRRKSWNKIFRNETKLSLANVMAVFNGMR